MWISGLGADAPATPPPPPAKENFLLKYKWPILGGLLAVAGVSFIWLRKTMKAAGATPAPALPTPAVAGLGRYGTRKRRKRSR